MSKYDDIIHLDAPVSKVHAQMPLSERAKIFSPFAALKGYQQALDQSLTSYDSWNEMSDEMMSDLNEKICYLIDHQKQHPYISLTFFNWQESRYYQLSGKVIRVDLEQQCIVLDDQRIALSDIYDLQLSLTEMV